ncbi:hypothetical protein [Acidocella sp.]|jgi:hypothetical protein|uniref:hypothetical protein n=1 Tax=Acidocella sp. TaxID=50710 RepID=UPI002F42731E
MATRTADRARLAWESLGRLLDSGIEELVRQEWQEVAVEREKMPLDLDWDQYQDMENSGLFRCCVAWRGKKLVGFNSFVTVKGHAHYRSTPHAMNDAIYVMPEERGVTGLRLILWAEKALREMLAPRAVRIIYQVKQGLPLWAPEGAVDSLEAASALMEAEEEFGVRLPDYPPPASGTLGDLLAWLGYKPFETSYGRFVG